MNTWEPLVTSVVFVCFGLISSPALLVQPSLPYHDVPAASAFPVCTVTPTPMPITHWIVGLSHAANNVH